MTTSNRVRMSFAPQRAYILLVFLAGLFVFPICSFAQYSREKKVLNDNPQLLLNDGVQVVGGIAFSVATVSTLKNTALAREFAIRRSGFKAKVQFLNFAIEGVNLKDLHPGLRPAFMAEAKRLWGRGQSLDLSGVQTIATDWTGLAYRIVLALPANKLSINTPHYHEVRDVVIQEALFAGRKVNPFLLLELVSFKKIHLAVDYLSLALATQFNDGNFSRMVRGEPLLKFYGGEAWENLVLNEDVLKQFTRSRLFECLSLRPYDPVLLVALADSFSLEGYQNCATLFRERSLIMLGTESNLLKNKDKWYHNMWKPITLNIHTNVYPYIYGDIAKLIVKYNGRLPIQSSLIPSSGKYLKGKALYHAKKSNLNECIRFMQESIDSFFSADACNYIGASYRYLEKYDLAIPFLVQASNTNPRHRYAAVHLLYCLYQLGMMEPIDEILRIQHATHSMDPWVLSQMKELKNLLGIN